MSRIFLLLTLFFSYPYTLCAEIQGLWDYYLNLYDSAHEDLAKVDKNKFHIIGEFKDLPNEIASKSWPYKDITYEIIASSKTDLSRLIYGIALYTKDIEPSITLKHFENGVLGFHYSIDQILDWANDIQQGKINFKSPGEIIFLNLLVQDNIIYLHNDFWESISSIKHIIGASESKKRSLTLNLTHERLHVLWDKDIDFNKSIHKKWLSLTSNEQEKVFASLKIYNKENTEQIIEEWGVRSYEANPPWN